MTQSPWKNWNQWEYSTWWRTHKMLCSSIIFSRYHRGILEGWAESRLGRHIDLHKTSDLTCPRMGSKKNNHGQNHGCKGPNIDTRWTYNKGIIIITRSFHDKFYIGSMGMNTKVQGRLPLLQCITFHSLLTFEEVVVLKFYLAKYQKNMTRENSRIPQIKEGIGSTHQGILVTYTISFKSKYTSSKAEHGWPSRGYNLPKALCIRGKAHKLS